jgi:hypothetical protein
MRFFPTAKEIDEAVELLVNKYELSIRLLSSLFGRDNRDQANDILFRLGQGRLDQYSLARLLVVKRGANLFSGGDEDSQKLRKYLLSKISTDDLKELFEKHCNRVNSIQTPGYMILES